LASAAMGVLVSAGLWDGTHAPAARGAGPARKFVRRRLAIVEWWAAGASDSWLADFWACARHGIAARGLEGERARWPLRCAWLLTAMANQGPASANSTPQRLGRLRPWRPEGPPNGSPALGSSSLSNASSPPPSTGFLTASIHPSILCSRPHPYPSTLNPPPSLSFCPHYSPSLPATTDTTTFLPQSLSLSILPAL
jgi:hypothetical protein